MSKLTKPESFSQVEIREENGFVFYRPKFKKDWYASGPEIARIFGSKNPERTARKIWKSHETYLSGDSILIDIPTKIKKSNTLPENGGVIISLNNHITRCYNKKGAWFFSSKIGTEQADEFLVQLFDGYDRLLRIKAPKSIERSDIREYGKIQRRGLTDAIQLFIEYATCNGSKGAAYYYKIITQKIHKHLLGVFGKGTPDNFRDSLSRIEIEILGVVEERVEDLLRDGMDRGDYYKEIIECIEGICTNGRACLVFSMPKQLKTNDF